MIKSRLGSLIDKEEVARLNDEAEWYAFKRDGTMVTGKRKDLINEARKQQSADNKPGSNLDMGYSATVSYKFG